MDMDFSTIRARIAEEVDAAERRRASRVAVGIDARVRPLGEEGCEAVVLNLSDTGFMATSDGDYDVGARIWLMVPGRDRRNAVVKWVAGHRFGAEFAEPRVKPL